MLENSVGRTSEELSFLASRWTEPPRIMIVSPHPDDEVIGAGTRLPNLPNSIVVQVTNGSPADEQDARAAGFENRDDYARARERELREALQLAGLRNVVHLGFPDQGTSHQLAGLTRSLREIIRAHSPDYLLTVPYEGGHPDHDSTALAVSAACGELESWMRPAIIEMLSYHERDGACEMEAFLSETPDVLSIELSESERNFKRRLFECFKTQQRVLCWFPIRFEKFRFAPRYNFLRAPHDGVLYYEKFPWGMEGAKWRQLARDALVQRALCES
jgi:LmbE family N-acetylglucosaminyl deacetylase